MALLPERAPAGDLVLRPSTKNAVPLIRAAASASLPELGERLEWAQREPDIEEFENYAGRFREAFSSNELWHFIIWERGQMVGGAWLAR